MADKTIDDGGSAFPVIPPVDAAGYPYPDAGITIRDWFAGQAISGVIRQCAHDLSFNLDIAPADYFAKKAFEIADAMIAARKGGAA